jgi:hypothetical protein
LTASTFLLCQGLSGIFSSSTYFSRTSNSTAVLTIAKAPTERGQFVACWQQF